MISYLSDLMEDATYCSWHGAKAAHAVVLCEMVNQIDCIHRAHAQKHVPHSKQNCSRN